jgi:hypothetical protein
MIPYAIDPSLHPAEPEPPLLDDGFSAPRRQGEAALPNDPHAPAASLEEALASKSDF